MSSDTLTSVAPVHRFILLTDIVQSSRLAEDYGREYLKALERHNQLVERAAEVNGGTVYKQTGDGYLVLFDTAEGCLEATLELGEALGQLEPVAEDEPLLVRLAMHAGSLQPSGQEYFGPVLNRVSRICQVCNPGQVLCSAAVATTLGKLPAGTLLEDLGQHHLRDLAEPEQLYQVESEKFSRHEFPPLTTLDNRPNNLVRQPNHFIGREKELRDLANLLLDDTYLLSIVAPGGYGKSRLAAQLCANLLYRFENGVFMTYLAPVRESLDVPTAVANALGFQFSGSREPEDQLCDYLRDKELLLCLDNFEHLMDSAPLIRKFLDAAPKLKIITTSREPLRLQGEHIYWLEPLAVSAADEGRLSEAQSLFADRAALVSKSFAPTGDNAAQVQRICQQLNGIPLAIELAAAWMDTFTLSELSEELSQQIELEARTSDRPERHSSLKASLDWSWNLLGEEQQSNLKKLSTFRGGFFSEAASELLGLKGMALRAALGRLTDKSWLYARDVNGQTRFFVRDMLALEYAFGKLQQSELLEPTVLAHAAYFSALMAREGPRLFGDGTPTGQSEALAAIQLEQQNIDEALDTLLKRLRQEDASKASAVLLVAIAGSMWKFLELTAQYRELIERYRALKRVAEQAGDLQHLLLWALLGCSRGQWRLGDYDAARDNASQARPIAEAIGDRYGIAMSLSGLGIVESDRGNYDAARELHAESLAVWREIGNQYGISASLNNLGFAEYRRGNFDTARELYAKSLAASREIGNRHAIAASLDNLGSAEYRRGNNDTARELHAESLAIMRGIGNRSGIAWSLSNQGVMEYIQNRYDTARELHAESLAIKREIGERYGIAVSLINLGNVEYVQGNFDTARELLTESLAIYREISFPRGEAQALHGLAVANYAFKEYRQAEELLSQALAIRLEIGDRASLCASLAASASVLATCDRLPPAAMCLYGALYCAEHLDYHFEPTERELLKQALEMIEHPETGLTATEREQLKAQAEAMSLNEVDKLALAALAKLNDTLPEGKGITRPVGN